MARSLSLAALSALLLSALSACSGTENSPAPQAAETPQAAAQPSARLPADVPLRPMRGDRVLAYQSVASDEGAAHIISLESGTDWVGSSAHYEAELLRHDLELQRVESEEGETRSAIFEGRRSADGLQARISLRQVGQGPIQVHFRWLPAHVED